MHKEAGGMGAVVAYTVVAAVLLHTGCHRTGQRHMCIERPAAWEQSSPIRSWLLYCYQDEDASEDEEHEDEDEDGDEDEGERG